ncbi:integrase [Lacimicrobium alkaliphilum]|uniref:Integrase n=2 Tax=Lacimicrobium alkaliphilum TaxID=1526571 RepID=A0A0U2Z326_9ALTE|nr:integrase [Lacimicrobium alkaliphilum]
MCEVLQVSTAGFYKWCRRVPGKREEANQTLLAFLLLTAEQEEGIPGYRKLWKAAVDEGFICSQNRVQRLLQASGYRSRASMKPGYQKPQPGMPVLPNLLNREFKVGKPNHVWTSDITQIRCAEGWLYIAVVLDLYSRNVVGWAASCLNSAELVKNALQGAWKKRQPTGSSLLFHSDQGCQYRSEKVIAWLHKRQVTISMSRKGNCWDNACTESFFAQMKKEWLSPLTIQSREETHLQAKWYIEEYYNTVRRHGTLNGVSPMAFEQQ